MVFKSKSLLSSAVMGLTLSVMCNSALAASIALSTTYISNFSMTAGGVDLTGFTYSNDSAATEGGGTGAVDTLDAPAACLGDCAGWENQFYAHDPYTTEFSYGDALIELADIQSGNGAASSIGEVMVTDGIAHASGSNVLTSISLIIKESVVLDFSLDAITLMETNVSGTGVSSAANTFFNITLTDNLGGTVFSWAPDQLNHGITGNTTYSFDSTASGVRPLSADTGSLTAGDYTLNIKMENQVNGAAVVPVPAAVWLFGSGLIGLIGLARRKKS